MKLAALYSSTKSLQNSCTAKLQLFSSLLEAKQQLHSSCSGMQKRCAAFEGSLKLSAAVLQRSCWPIRNEQGCCSAAEWLQEVLQKSCESAGLQQSQILAAVESPLTAINSAFAVAQKIPESRSALQSGCKVALKRQWMLLPVMAYHSLVQKIEMHAPIIQSWYMVEELTRPSYFQTQWSSCSNATIQLWLIWLSWAPITWIAR